MPQKAQLSHLQLQERLGRIYDRMRTACLNKNYYGHKLHRCTQIDLWWNIIIIIGTSTTVGAWSVWKVPGGLNLWTMITGLTTVLALIRPVVRLSSRIEKLAKLHDGYARLYYDLRSLVDDIKSDQGLTSALWERFRHAEARYNDLAVKDDLKPSRRLQSRCEDQVREQFPVDFFWNPRED